MTALERIWTSANLPSRMQLLLRLPAEAPGGRQVSSRPPLVAGRASAWLPGNPANPGPEVSALQRESPPGGSGDVGVEGVFSHDSLGVGRHEALHRCSLGTSGGISCRAGIYRGASRKHL